MTNHKIHITTVIGGFIILISCLVMIGWFYDISVLKSVIPGLISMKFNTAICFLLIGLCLLLLDHPKKNITKPFISIAALMVLTVSTVTLCEYIFNLNLGIDEYLWREGPGTPGTMYPGRISVPAAISFVLTALIILFVKKRKTLFFIWLALMGIFLISGLAFLGYIFSIPYLNSSDTLTKISFPSAIVFILICIAIYYSYDMDHMLFSFRQKLSVGFLLIAVVLSIVIFIYNKNDQELTAAAKRVAHTNDVLYNAEKMISTLTAAESAVRAYALTNDVKLINSFGDQKNKTIFYLSRLKALTTDNAWQQKRIDTLYGLLNKRFQVLEATVRLRENKPYSESQFLVFVREGLFTMNAIRSMIGALQEDENNLLVKREHDTVLREDNARRIIYFFGFIMLLMLVILLLLILSNISARMRAETEIRSLNDTLENRVKERSEALLDAEYKFHYTLDHMMEGAQIIDFDWRYVYVNDAFLNYSRYTREEMIGYTVMEKYPGIEETAIYQVYLRCFNQRESIHLENRFVFPDGSVGWFELSFQPLPDGIFILSVDITARKLSEISIKALNEEIARREKRFRTIIESSNDIISLSDKDLKTVYRSPSADRITGWTAADREGSSPADIMHVDDLLHFNQALQRCLVQPGIPVPMSFRVRHKNGHYVWLEGTATNMLHDDSLQAIVTNLQDITARKEVEEKILHSERIYRTVVSSIPGSVICLFDTGYRYILVEGDLLNKMGYSKEAVYGKTIQEVLSKERYEELLPYFKKVFNGETFRIEETRAGFDTIMQFVPILDTNELVYSAMVVIYDVSELKNAERAIAELNRGLEDKILERTAQLAAANKELESFSYSVSHDLRAPLRGIDGCSLALLEDYGSQLDERAHKYLDRVRTETQRMGELIDDMLKLSRVSRAEVKRSTVNMSEMAAAIVQRISMEYENREVLCTIAPDLLVNGDFNMLDIMLTNLIANAFKFTGKTNRAQIEMGKTTDHGQDVFFIKDNGVGFNMENAKNLFGAFQRMHRQSEFPGTGIGLATVQRIIHLHQGKIWAEAAVNLGAIFYFMIPNKPI